MLSQQGLGNCHPSQSCLWLSWENRKLSIWHSRSSSSQVHAKCTQSSRQPASWLNAKKAAAGLRRGEAGGKDQYSDPKPINKLLGSCSPSEAGAHTSIPEAFVLPTEPPFLLFSQGPGQCQTICEGPGVHHITALETCFCLSPLQTLYWQAPDSLTGHFTGMISNSGMTHRGNFVPC